MVMAPLRVCSGGCVSKSKKALSFPMAAWSVMSDAHTRNIEANKLQLDLDPGK